MRSIRSARAASPAERSTTLARSGPAQTASSASGARNGAHSPLPGGRAATEVARPVARSIRPTNPSAASTAPPSGSGRPEATASASSANGARWSHAGSPSAGGGACGARGAPVRPPASIARSRPPSSETTISSPRTSSAIASPSSAVTSRYEAPASSVRIARPKAVRPSARRSLAAAAATMEGRPSGRSSPVPPRAAKPPAVVIRPIPSSHGKALTTSPGKAASLRSSPEKLPAA
ncbi:hypothetical protein [Sorangium cellulosum]|uniref:hypothetical protein n=1 Tax=Sorangium cellulosum TaxID=56 RepID=UPI000CF53750|nr:hypothetical protein [Sorangium cellulosum]